MWTDALWRDRKSPDVIVRVVGSAGLSGGDVTYRYEREGKWRRTSTIPHRKFLARFEPVPAAERGEL